MTRTTPWPRPWGLWTPAWLACVLLAITSIAHAQPPPTCVRPVLTLAEAADLLRINVGELERLAERGQIPARRVAESWRFSCAAIMAWLSPSPIPPEGLAQVAATGLAHQTTPTPSTSAASVPSGQDAPVGEAPAERDAEDVFLRGQRVLLGRGEVVVDFGQFYSRSDDTLLATVGGGVGLATVQQRTFSSLVVGRVGIFAETELFAATTFHSQASRQFLESTTLARQERSELGEVNFGIRRTLLREGAGRPDIVITFDGHIPTGDTPYAVGGGLVFVKSIDPVVLFASANYVHAFEWESASGVRVRPDNRVDVSMGYGLGLNDTVAISMSVSGVFAGMTVVDGTRFRQPGSFSGRFGLTSWLAKGLYIEPSVSFGLTGPGDRFAFGVTVPYAF